MATHSGRIDAMTNEHSDGAGREVDNFLFNLVRISLGAGGSSFLFFVAEELVVVCTDWCWTASLLVHSVTRLDTHLAHALSYLLNIYE